MKRIFCLISALLLFFPLLLQAGPFMSSGGGVALQDSDGSSGGCATTLKLPAGDWSVTGGVATLPTGASDNETLINRLITAGTAAKALALNANGANCSAGQAPLGVDAAGAVEGCFAVQSSNADLTAIAALTCTENQIMKMNGSDAWVCAADETGTGDNETLITRLATEAKANAALPMNGTVGATSPAAGTFTTLAAGATGFAVDDDGDTTAKSYSVTRGDWPQRQEFFEATSDGDNKLIFEMPAKGTGKTATEKLIFPAASLTVGQFWRVASIDTGNATLEAFTPLAAGTATGGVILGDDSPDAAGELGYASTQLSVHDGTASRSLLQVASTTITKYQYFPIRYAEDNATGTAPAAVAEIGTTSLVGRSFVEDADNTVVFWWQVDPEWTAGLKYRVYYAIQTDADADETVAFGLGGCSIGNTDAAACTEGTFVVVTDELTTDHDANEMFITGWSDAVTVTDLAVGEFAKLNLIRDVSEDDYAGANDNVFVIGIEIKYQAKISASTDY